MRETKFYCDRCGEEFREMMTPTGHRGQEPIMLLAKSMLIADLCEKCFAYIQSEARQFSLKAEYWDKEEPNG